MLQHIIEQSAIPLVKLDNILAIDSTGFSQHYYSRYLDDKHNHEKLYKDYCKLHIMVGTSTNIIVCARVTKSNVTDSTMFRELLLDASRYYDIKEVSGGKAYSSRKNMDLAVSVGAIPFFPFKINVGGRSKGYSIWKTMYKFYSENREMYMQHYHMRSNVESTNSMIKRKFGKKLMTKTFEGKTNEILLKCIAHNVEVLAEESYEFQLIYDLASGKKFKNA